MPSLILGMIIGSIISRDACGFRIPLSFDTQTPFLQHTSGNAKRGNSFSHDTFSTFSWSNVFLGKLLHKSDIVEIGPRGIRFIHLKDSSISSSGLSPVIAVSDLCEPTDLALCYPLSREGWILPSEGKWPPPLQFNITSNSTLLRDDVLKLFAGETACHGENQGSGRVYNLVYYDDTDSNQKPNTVYSVTSCDILQGKYLMVYFKESERIGVYPQTFGPIAYFLILISATISTGGIAFLNKISSQTSISTGAAKDQTVSILVHSVEMTAEIAAVAPRPNLLSVSYIFNTNALSSIIVCCGILARGKIHFHSFEDALVFWVAAISGLFYTFLVSNLLYLSRGAINYYQQCKTSFEIDSCMYALDTIAIALYRTPETPYASILVLFMACRIWEKYFLYCHGRSQARYTGSVRYLIYADLVLALINFDLICEIGMREQYIFQDTWAFYFILILFLTFCLIKYQWMIAVTIV